jgi:hypothetical protein
MGINWDSPQARPFDFYCVELLEIEGVEHFTEGDCVRDGFLESQECCGYGDVRGRGTGAQEVMHGVHDLLPVLDTRAPHPRPLSPDRGEGEGN